MRQGGVAAAVAAMAVNTVGFERCARHCTRRLHAALWAPLCAAARQQFHHPSLPSHLARRPCPCSLPQYPRQIPLLHCIATHQPSVSTLPPACVSPNCRSTCTRCPPTTASWCGRTTRTPWASASLARERSAAQRRVHTALGVEEPQSCGVPRGAGSGMEGSAARLPPAQPLPRPALGPGAPPAALGGRPGCPSLPVSPS